MTALPMLTENAHGKFADDAVLPIQFFEQQRQGLSPELRLQLAIVESAVRDVFQYVAARDRRGRRLYREAIEYIYTDDYEWPSSFASCCLNLGMDPDYLRRGLDAAIRQRQGVPRARFFYRPAPRG